MIIIIIMIQNDYNIIMILRGTNANNERAQGDVGAARAPGDGHEGADLRAAPETEGTIFETPRWLKRQDGSRKQKRASAMSKRKNGKTAKRQTNNGKLNRTSATPKRQNCKTRKRGNGKRPKRTRLPS